MTTIRSCAVRSRIELLDSLAFVATEHAGALDLLTLVGYADLYARHLELVDADGSASTLDFETFASDAGALERAAREAERQSGVPTRSPGPIEAAPAAGRPRRPNVPGTPRLASVG